MIRSVVLSLFTSPRAGLLFGELFFKLLGMRQKGEGIDLSQVKRVLVVRLDKIGDMVRPPPFLRELRGLLPNAWITLIVKPGEPLPGGQRVSCDRTVRKFNSGALHANVCVRT
jgi:hypothetical protein